MSDENQKKRKKITTSALMTKRQEAEVIQQMEEIEKAQAEAQAEIAADPNAKSSAALRPKVAPWTKSEPLTKIHSILGHIAQGDIYRNELDLVYDRLTGDAEAPEYVPSEADEQAEDAFEPILTRGDDPWSSDQFSFGESSGSISFEPKQTPPEVTPHQNSTEQILDGLNLNEFDLLHQSAKSSGMLTKDDVDSFLEKNEPALSDQDLELLSGAQEPMSEISETDNISDPFETSVNLPKRERGLQHSQEPFFTQSDTFSEINFDTPNGTNDEAPAELQFADSFSESNMTSESTANASSNDFALGDAEDTIID